MQGMLKSKICKPLLHQHIIRRPRISKAIKKAFDQGASSILICAPFGYGKTIALSEWHERIKGSRTVAWLSLDAYDNDPASFISYLQQSLAFALDTDMSLTTTGALGPDSRIIVSQIMGSVENQACDVTLCLDDLHVLFDPWVTGVVRLLVQNASEKFNVIIASRTYPEYLRALHVSGALFVLDRNDLAFTDDETELIASHIASVQDGIIESISKETEGWPLATRLAIASCGHDTQFANGFRSGPTDSNPVSNVIVTERLFTEYFRSLPEDERKVLSIASLFDYFCLPEVVECTPEYMLDSQTCATALHRMIDDTSFITCIGEQNGNPWFRMHALLCSEAKRRLPMEMPQNTSREIYRRAALWLHDQGSYTEMMQYACKGQDDVFAAECLNAACVAQAYESPNYGYFDLEIWCNKIADEAIGCFPIIHIMLGLKWALEDFMKHKKEIRRIVEEIDRDSDDQNMQRYGTLLRLVYETANTNENLTFDEIWLEKASRLYPPTDPYRIRFEQLRGYVYNRLGSIERSLACFNHALVYSKASKSTVMRYGLIGNIVTALYLMGRLDEALDRCDAEIAGFSDCYWTIAPNTLRPLRALILLNMGRLDESHEELVRDAEIPTTKFGELLRTEVTKHLKRLLGPEKCATFAEGVSDEPLDCRDYIDGDASRPDVCWATTLPSELAVEPTLAHLARKSRMSKAVLDGTAEQCADVITTCDETLGFYMGTQITLLRCDPLMLKSCALFRLGRKSEALAVAREALTLYAAIGKLDTLLGLPRAFMPLIMKASEDDKNTVDLMNQVKRIKHDLAKPSSNFTTPQIRHETDLAKLILTGRETQILSLVGKGLTNRMIAERLSLSIPTVKSHLYNASQKLGASNRSEAVFLARKLNLI